MSETIIIIIIIKIEQTRTYVDKYVSNNYNNNDKNN